MVNPLIKLRLQDSVKKLLREAERYYCSAELGLAYLPIRARLAILVAARVYRAIGGVRRHKARSRRSPPYPGQACPPPSQS